MGILKYIAPKWAYKRQAYRQAYELSRNYDAGTFDRQNRNWRAHNESAELTDRDYRDVIRARSRDLERNSDLMNAQIHPWTRNVVGKGFELEAMSDDQIFNDEIEKLWRKWCKKDNCDVTGSQSFWEMARMAVRRKRVDGGILFIKCYTPGGVTPFKLQALEVDELDTVHIAPKYEGNKVVGGIEYNSYNFAVGYWVREYDIQGYLRADSRFIERKNIIFYFSKDRPSQIREMPEMASTLTRIKEVNGYIEAATIKERIAACLSVFIKNMLPAPIVGRNPADGKPRDYKELKLSPGMVTQLNQGDEVEVVNPGTSATNGNEFIKTMSRIISAGQGVSYEATSRDLTQANYSSARQATIEDEETFIPEQQKLKDEFLDEAYETFVISAVLSGAVECPDFWKRKDEYLAHKWNRKPKKWIDPQKEANANKTALATGQKTLPVLWAEDGRDYKEVMDEMKKVQDYAKEIGLKSDLVYLTGGEDNAGQQKI
ncbi:phage portal protein [Lachnospiraceae bacterium MD329]|nr:phage portal protein [Lachnospiraceae bacterium MD329]